MPRVIHFEVHADEPERAVVFYRSVFGWEFHRFGTQDYWLIKTGPRDQPGIDGGLLRRKGGVAVDAMNGYVCTVAVPSLSEYLARVLSSGGLQVADALRIEGVGWLAYCKDPEGNIFGMMEADRDAA